jgi:organic radical activating enzyme
MAIVSKLRAVNSIVPDGKLLKLPAGRLAVNEIFLSIQGEGAKAGTLMVFIRFAECNLRCTNKNAGFDCDTEFSSYRDLGLKDVLTEIEQYKSQSEWVLLTGGEPALQITSEIISALRSRGWKIAVETNGTISLPQGIDWITVSPKTAEHTLRQRTANEVKYVRARGSALPQTTLDAQHYFISPAFQPHGELQAEDLEWCIELIKQAPEKWRLSIQLHKFLGLR